MDMLMLYKQMRFTIRIIMVLILIESEHPLTRSKINPIFIYLKHIIYILLNMYSQKTLIWIELCTICGTDHCQTISVPEKVENCFSGAFAGICAPHGNPVFICGDFSQRRFQIFSGRYLSLLNVSNLQNEVSEQPEEVWSVLREFVFRS